MIAYLSGDVIGTGDSHLVVEMGGVGLLVNVPAPISVGVRVGENIHLHTHLVVREDALILYGFADTGERHVFQQLISVSGVGPNTARLILSALTSSEVADAIATENVKLLQSIKGIE